MSRISLGKKELNERFYSAVDPEAAFGTEVQVGFHQVAAARLIARHAASLGKRRVRILELGASACLFAIAFLDVISRLALLGDASIESIDYTAVELSRGALEAAVRSAAQAGFEQLAPAGGSPRSRSRGCGAPGAVEAELLLVPSDANRFVDETDEPYDVVILNELLDDLPCRVFYADDRGATHELSPHARPGGPGWHVRLEETDAGSEQLPPGTLRSTSDESVRLLQGIVGRLSSGGMVLSTTTASASPSPPPASTQSRSSPCRSSWSSSIPRRRASRSRSSASSATRRRVPCRSRTT